MTPSELIAKFVSDVRRIRGAPSHHPETSLYGAFERLVQALPDALGLSAKYDVVQQAGAEGAGVPDFAVFDGKRAPIGWIEAKAPDKDLDRLKGRDRAQLERYRKLPNLILTNYWDLRLLQDGEEVAQAVLVPRPSLDPRLRRSISPSEPRAALDLVRRFLMHSPPALVSAGPIAKTLAHAASLVRDAVEEAMSDPGADTRALREVFTEYRDVLFSDLDEKRFADAYAQTVTYGLLLARQASGRPLDMESLASHLDRRRHRLLRATLELLGRPEVTKPVGWTLQALVAQVNRIAPEALRTSAEGRDPLLYFYEDFLAEYDPEMRKALGIYYTPPAVVRFQVRWIADLLRDRFYRPLAFADENVNVLDPAAGTGTYLVAAIKETVGSIAAGSGRAAAKAAATRLAEHLHGFEILVGPYTVAHYRLSAAFEEAGIASKDRLRILLTDTLARPAGAAGVTGHFGFLSEPITEERTLADEVKARTPVLVILGNPPWGRRKAIPSEWIWRELLEDFRKDVPRKWGVHLKSLADWYVYFYRWAIWKLIDQPGAPRRGVLSFISNRSWLLGEAFAGMRAKMRRDFDEIWIVDLHGDGKAPKPPGVGIDENVFEIQAGAAIAVCVADGSKKSAEATVRYAEIWGSREEKFEALEKGWSSLSFRDLTGGGIAPLVPVEEGPFSSWPSLEDIFVKRFSGVQTKRDELVVGPTKCALKSKLQRFFGLTYGSPERRSAFRETRDRAAEGAIGDGYDAGAIRSYGYRPMDRSYLYNVRALIDFPRPDLQVVWGDADLGLVTLVRGHGSGPAAFVHRHLPDLCSYRGSFSSHVFPLWDRAAGLRLHPSNIREELLRGLSQRLGFEVTPEACFNYIYSILGGEEYATRFRAGLRTGFPRVPSTANAGLFQEAISSGHDLVALHTLETRYPNDGSLKLEGDPREIVRPEWKGDAVRVAEAAWLRPVDRAMWEYSVSGYPVLRRWIERRQRLRLAEEGLASELLQVAFAVRESVRMRPALADLLRRVVEGRVLTLREIGA